MKTLLLALLASTLLLTGCISGSYEAYGYSSSGYSCPTRPYQQTYFVGPQYYKTYEYGCGNRVYKNYTDAPVVVERRYGGSVIIPRSWN